MARRNSTRESLFEAERKHLFKHLFNTTRHARANRRTPKHGRRYRMDGGVADITFFRKSYVRRLGGAGSVLCNPRRCVRVHRATYARRERVRVHRATYARREHATAAGQSVFRVWPIGARSPRVSFPTGRFT